MRLLLNTVCGTDATTGVLTIGDSTFHTIEAPWHDNQADVSCVPAGEYELIPYVSPSHGQTWCLHNPDLGLWGRQDTDPPSPMRTVCEIHNGNLASQSKGCILVGLAEGEMLDSKTDKVEPAVLDSDVAFDQVRSVLGSAEGNTLLITREGLYG